VVGLLGRGGMGLVYDVEHLELGKRFVLKGLLSDLAGREDIVARLRNEQRALGRLQHPNIVAVTDAGVTSTGIPFFVMERLEGETLGARLKRVRRLPVVEAMKVARGVLEGLSAAHEIGVVHRDIKPQNIFLASNGRPKVLDFGVAKIADAVSVITARGVAIGTPRYMSPEQVSGERVDGRSDLYAVGLLLFETIAGVGPFDDARDANEMLLAHLGKPAPPLGDIASGVTRELDALIRSLLAKAPRDRPPTARAAIAALAAVADRYGGGSNLDAPTPLGSYSSTTQPILVPGGTQSALATRPDGVAARDPLTIADAKEKTRTTEIMPHAAGGDRTLIDEPRAPGGTLYDPSSRAVTVAHALAAMPIDAVRTERLETVAVPVVAAEEPTHTRVPTTPSDGTPSVVPVRVDAPRSERGRPNVRWLGGAVVVVLLGGAYAWLGADDASTSGASALESARPAKPQEIPGPVPALASAAAPQGVMASPGIVGLAPAVATSTVAAPKATASSVRQVRPAVSASSSAAAPSRAISTRKPLKGPEVIPPGLPGSGL
jgi:eukaryotic-like serine/threonine-protein kinase